MDNPQTNLALARFIVPFASFTTPFLGSSINVALPAVAAEFDMDAVTSGWFTTSYFLAAAMFMLQAARLGDIYGRRKFYLAGLLLIAGSSLVMLFSGSANQLLFWRFIQGIGGALIFGTSHAIMASIFPPEWRGRALGLNVTAIYLGMTCGPFLGGVLTHQFGWRSLFILAGGMCLVGVFLFNRYIHGEWAEAAGEKFDWLGGFWVAAALAALVVGSGRLPQN
ncbi:MAG: MFS transporter, partial [Gammaproteobacteria bacterium]